MVLSYLGINTKHSFIGPCKHFLKFCEKLFEILSFFFIRVEPILIKREFSSLPKLIVSKVGSIVSIFFSNFLLTSFSNSLESFKCRISIL